MVAQFLFCENACENSLETIFFFALVPPKEFGCVFFWGFVWFVSFDKSCRRNCFFVLNAAMSWGCGMPADKDECTLNGVCWKLIFKWNPTKSCTWIYNLMEISKYCVKLLRAFKVKGIEAFFKGKLFRNIYSQKFYNWLITTKNL